MDQNKLCEINKLCKPKTTVTIWDCPNCKHKNFTTLTEKNIIVRTGTFNTGYHRLLICKCSCRRCKVRTELLLMLT